MTNGTMCTIFMMTAAIGAVSPAVAEDVRSVKLREQGLKVIEEKCLVCHNRQRIDAAIKEQKDMDKVMRRMEKKGVVVTDKERQVMGHFWRQKIYKAKESEAKP